MVLRINATCIGTIDRGGPKQEDRSCDQNDKGNQRNDRIRIRWFFDAA